MAKENIDHTFKLKQMGRGGYTSWYDDRTKCWFCRETMARVFGKVPKEFDHLYLRICSFEPTDDPEVEFVPIRLKKVKGGTHMLNIFWTSGKKSIPRGNFFDHTSQWLIKKTKSILKPGEVKTFWFGVWVVEQ